MITDTRRDPRYSGAKWRKVRLAVLRRDLYRCWVVNCEVAGNVADHINPVYLGMPDSEFFDPQNLRASCKRHNTARGVAARLERDMAGQQYQPIPKWPTVRWGR